MMWKLEGSVPMKRILAAIAALCLLAVAPMAMAAPEYCTNAQGTAVDCSSLPWSYAHITTGTTTTPVSAPAVLHAITVNTLIASATITIYDNTAASGTKIATITLPSTITGVDPFTLYFDVPLGIGLTIVTSGATDITVAYR